MHRKVHPNGFIIYSAKRKKEKEVQVCEALIRITRREAELRIGIFKIIISIWTMVICKLQFQVQRTFPFVTQKPTT